MSVSNCGLVLLTGATGYVGGRLLQVLEQRGYRVRAMARQPEHLQPKVAPSTEVVQGDVLDIESLRRALANEDTACALTHWSDAVPTAGYPDPLPHAHYGKRLYDSMASSGRVLVRVTVTGTVDWRTAASKVMVSPACGSSSARRRVS